MDSVKTFRDEATGFTKRHPDLNATQQAFGGVLLGMMKALAECPDCPGVFRVPFDADWTPNAFGEWKYLGCPKCEKIWERAQPETEPEPKRKSSVHKKQVNHA